MDELTKMARAVAIGAHLGQVDKAGQPYFEHVNRVAHRVTVYRDPVCLAVAYLHDVVKDTDITLDVLNDMWFPQVVIEAVDAITHRPREFNSIYWGRVMANEVARHVKLADIDDNANPARLELLDVVTRIRLQRKYREAREALT